MLQELTNQQREEITTQRKSRDDAVTQLHAAKTERANFEIQLHQAEKLLSTAKDKVSN